MVKEVFSGSNQKDQTHEIRDLIRGLSAHSGTYFEKYAYEDLYLGAMVSEITSVFLAMTQPMQQMSVTPKGSDEELHLKISLFLRGEKSSRLSFNYHELGFSEEDKDMLIQALNDLAIHERQIAGMVNPWLKTTLEEKDRDSDFYNTYPGYKPQISFNKDKTPDNILKGVPKQICSVCSDKTKTVLLKSWKAIEEYAQSSKEYEEKYMPNKRPIPKKMAEDMRKLGELLEQTIYYAPMAPAATGFKPQVLDGGKA